MPKGQIDTRRTLELYPEIRRGGALSSTGASPRGDVMRAAPLRGLRWLMIVTRCRSRWWGLGSLFASQAWEPGFTCMCSARSAGFTNGV